MVMTEVTFIYPVRWKGLKSSTEQTFFFLRTFKMESKAYFLSVHSYIFPD